MTPDENKPLCPKCVVLEGSHTRMKSKLDARDYIFFHVKSHLLEAHNLGQPVDAGKLLQFIFKRECEVDL
jgi:hypothetical protein